jgi:response regulator NasT
VASVKSVLIYDDEPIIRAGVKNKLKELGFDLIFDCFDGSSAVSTAIETLPDLAILNAMPKNDGLRAAREIRQKLKIPVILLMSFCDQDTLNRAKKIGITAILAKPFRGQDLLPAIVMAFTHAEELELIKEYMEG